MQEEGGVGGVVGVGVGSRGDMESSLARRALWRELKGSLFAMGMLELQCRRSNALFVPCCVAWSAVE